MHRQGTQARLHSRVVDSSFSFVSSYDETTFCDEVFVKSIINSKSVFDRLNKNEMREARTRSNRFEKIRGAIFLNRAAVKMANMDRTCDLTFTQPHNLHPDELLYFADVCAGPGGFSEYILWRKKSHAKGFGFTFKSENNFKLHDFHGELCETFHPYYGQKMMVMYMILKIKSLLEN